MPFISSQGALPDKQLGGLFSHISAKSYRFYNTSLRVLFIHGVLDLNYFAAPLCLDTRLALSVKI